MKVLSIKISNILSFKYAKMEDCTEYKFDEDLNVLIGANGAGKSNFLEILNQVFKKGIVSTCDLNFNNLKNFDGDSGTYSLKNTIISQPKSHTLEKNYSSDSNDQEIKLKIKLNKNDFENMFFVLDNIEQINLFLEKYTNQPTRFHTTVTKEKIKSISEIIFSLKSDSVTKKFTCTTNLTEIDGQFIQDYFLLSQFIQNLITVSNSRESTNWKSLKNTFALIGSYRNYNSISSVFDLNTPKLERLRGINDRIVLDETRVSKNEEPIIFEYIKNKLSVRLHEIETELTEGKLPNPKHQRAFDFMKNEKEFKNFNELLRTYLEITLEITKEPETLKYNFNFKDKNEKDVILGNLSAGEKGIIHFIFSIYGYDLESGLMVIDEPEIHLHPQIQEKYLDIIWNTIKELKLQFIIATHSPIFVNAKTIEHVYRFYKNPSNFTQIKTCSTISSDMKSRIQMLTYTNSAVVFFSDHVILTEGYRDYIYFKKYLDSYSIRHQKDISKISLLEMHSSGEYEKWAELLQEFNIITSYIGDADNLKISNISSKSDIWMQISPKKMLQNQILTLKQSNGSIYDDMIKEIKSLTERDIFLLTEGSFEDYFLALTSIPKTTENVTKFSTSEKFDTWYDSNYFKKYAIEFESIIRQILNQSPSQ